MKVIDRKDKVLKNKTILIVKVMWRNNKVKESDMGTRFRHAGSVSRVV